MSKSEAQPKPTRKRKIVKQDITKEEFLVNLGKVCQPISKESSASLPEPYASQLKFVRAYDQCPHCKQWVEGHIVVEKGMLIGTLKLGEGD